MKTSILTTIILSILLSISFTSCSSQDDKEKEFEVDQEITDGTGQVTFARAHYIEAKTDAMNRVFEKKMMGHLREYCTIRKLNLKMLRNYHTQTDFITLKYDFRQNRKVHVFEFQCI